MVTEFCRNKFYIYTFFYDNSVYTCIRKKKDATILKEEEYY